MSSRKIKVWDGAIRLFHWTLAILFVLSAYSAFQDKFGTYADMHFYAGYSILILVVWRILWGLVGSDTARFSTFIKTPMAAVRHLKAMASGESYKEIGHSPLAGFSVMLMLILLLAQAVMGLFATDGMIFSGPLSSSVSGSMGSDLTSWHKLLGKILIGLISLHVLVVLLYGLLKRANLVWPMIVGKTKVSAGAVEPGFRPVWLSLLVFFAAGGLVCTLVFVL